MEKSVKVVLIIMLICGVWIAFSSQSNPVQAGAGLILTIVSLFILGRDWLIDYKVRYNK